jgi:hypothetical protein
MGFRARFVRVFLEFQSHSAPSGFEARVGRTLGKKYAGQLFNIQIAA